MIVKREKYNLETIKTKNSLHSTIAQIFYGVEGVVSPLQSCIIQSRYVFTFVRKLTICNLKPYLCAKYIMWSEYKKVI